MALKITIFTLTHLPTPAVAMHKHFD